MSDDRDPLDPVEFYIEGEGRAINPKGEIISVGARVVSEGLTGTVSVVLGVGEDAALVIELDEAQVSGRWLACGVEAVRMLEVA